MQRNKHQRHPDQAAASSQQRPPAVVYAPAQQGHNNSNHHAYLFVLGIPKYDPLLQKSGEFAYTASFEEEQQQQQQREQRQKLNSDLFICPTFAFDPPTRDGLRWPVSNCTFNRISNCTFNCSISTLSSRLGANCKSRRCGFYVDWHALSKCTDEHSCASESTKSGWGSRCTSC